MIYKSPLNMNIVRNHSPLNYSNSKREFVPKSISNDQIQQLKNQIVTDITQKTKENKLVRTKNFS